MGYADQASSSTVHLTAQANAVQPNKSAFVGWTCSAAPSNICGPSYVLTEGAHTFSVRAVGDLIPATRTFVIDAVPPAVVVGTPAPAPVPAPARPLRLKVAVTASGKGTRLRSLSLRGVPLDATVTVVCSGRGCPRTRVSKRGATKITAFHTLPLKAKLTVTVSAPGMLPAVATVTPRRGRAPRVTQARSPGTTSPVS